MVSSDLDRQLLRAVSGSFGFWRIIVLNEGYLFIYTNWRINMLFWNEYMVEKYLINWRKFKKIKHADASWVVSV